MLVSIIALIAAIFVVALVAVSVKIVLDDKADKARARRNHDFKVQQHFSTAGWNHIQATKNEKLYRPNLPTFYMK